MVDSSERGLCDKCHNTGVCFRPAEVGEAANVSVFGERVLFNDPPRPQPSPPNGVHLRAELCVCVRLLLAKLAHVAGLRVPPSVPHYPTELEDFSPDSPILFHLGRRHDDGQA